MALDPNDIVDYSDADILRVLRQSLVNAALCTQYSYQGKQLIRMSGTQIHALIEIYETRIAAAAGRSGIALSSFGRS